LVVPDADGAGGSPGAAAMTLDPTVQAQAAGQDPFEDGSGAGPRVTPIAVAPLARIRSPILERRLIEDLPAQIVPPSLGLPPLRVFIGPARFALIVSAPVLLFVGLQVALIVAVAAPLLRAVRDRADRTTISLGEGFLPYRAETGWPRGVQEDNDVRWNWAATADGRGAAG
jgi:hypothetical protein